jgi:hypothetical protein
MMNKFNKNILAILLFSVVLVLDSCEKEIDFKGDVSEPRLVLNALVELDSAFRIHLESSQFFLSNSDQSSMAISSGATVVVKNLSTNQTYEMTESTSGSLYEFPFLVTPYTSYSVEVTHPDFESISATTQTLSAVPIVSIDTSSVVQNNEDRLRFELKFNDPAGDENYYLIQVELTETYDEENTYTYPMSLGSTDPAIDNAGNTEIDGSTYDQPYLLLEDKTFNGANKTLIFSSYNPFAWSGGTIDEFKVTLINMNKETFLYLKSVNLFNQQDFFSEPVKIFSNVLNGFGIFGFMSYSVVEL